MSTKVRRLLATFIIASAVGTVVEVAALSYKASYNLIHPRRIVGLETPARYGFPYEGVEFSSRDGTRLKGWFIPGPSKATVILAHGYGADRSSMLPIARFLRQEGGFSTFLFDFRASGESGGDKVTVGYYEREDILAAVAYLKGRPDVAPDGIGAFGESMGASVVIMAGAQTGDLKAIVADSPFQSLPALLGSSFRAIFGLPAFPFKPISVWFAEAQAGLPISAAAPIDDISKISPNAILVIHGAKDDLIPLKEANALYQAAGEPKELWIVEDAGHGEAFYQAKEEYQRRVVEFFREYLGEADVPAGRSVELDGFKIELSPGRPHRAGFDAMPAIFEEHPRSVAIPSVQTNHGLNGAGNLAKAAGADLPVRDSARNLPGTWLAHVITNEMGKAVAMRLGSNRPGPGLPSQFQIEGISMILAQPAVVEGPTREFTDSDGIIYFPPQEVNVRGFRGVLLRQERAQSDARPLNTLVWKEGDMYWKLSGWDPPDRTYTYYTADWLLEVANQELVQWDPATGSWIRIK